MPSGFPVRRQKGRRLVRKLIELTREEFQGLADGSARKEAARLEKELKGA